MIKRSENSAKKSSRKGIIFATLICFLTAFLIFLLFGSRDLNDHKKEQENQEITAKTNFLKQNQSQVQEKTTKN